MSVPGVSVCVRVCELLSTLTPGTLMVEDSPTVCVPGVSVYVRVYMTLCV